MDFSFTSEQEDLRREALFVPSRTRRRRSTSWRRSAGSGSWQSDDFSDAVVLFEELGRVLYDGPVHAQRGRGAPAEEVWSIEIDGFVPHLQR